MGNTVKLCGKPEGMPPLQGQPCSKLSACLFVGLTDHIILEQEHRYERRHWSPQLVSRQLPLPSWSRWQISQRATWGCLSPSYLGNQMQTDSGVLGSLISHGEVSEHLGCLSWGQRCSCDHQLSIRITLQYLDDGNRGKRHPLVMARVEVCSPTGLWKHPSQTHSGQ